MAHDVHKSLENVLQVRGNKTPQQVARSIKEMRTNGRYQTDVWS
jgi:sulfite reductase alpha subunit-like flavoprotein